MHECSNPAHGLRTREGERGLPFSDMQFLSVLPKSRLGRFPCMLLFRNAAGLPDRLALQFFFLRLLGSLGCGGMGCVWRHSELAGGSFSSRLELTPKIRGPAM